MKFPASNHETAEEHTAAVQRLFIQHQPMVRSFILGMIPDFSMADDVVQETFMVVTRKAAAFEVGTSFPAWVKTIARYKALEAIRASRGKMEFLSEEVLDVLFAESHDLPENVDQRLQHLSHCLNQLAPTARKAIDYRYRHDYRPPEIARLIGCTIQSINVTLSRARALLRSCVSRRAAKNPV